MFSEKIYTLDEVSQQLRVPEDAVMHEVGAGRLRVVRLAGLVRFLGSDLNSYLKQDFETAESRPSNGITMAAETRKPTQKFRPVHPFDHAWPAKKGETRYVDHFTDGVEGIETDGDQERHIKIGFALRKSAGKSRRRGVIFVDRYPTVEFAAADENPNGKIASIIKDRRGKQLPVGATLPPEYKELPVGPYNDIVKGPRAANGMAVVCDPDDFGTMVKHALIRYRFREARG